MSFEFKADPANRQILIDLGNSSQGVRRGIRQGFWHLARELRKDAQQAITKGPKTGVLYRPRGGKRRRRRSAPGEAPANQTGTLRKSVGFEIKGTESMVFGYRDSAPYGKFLEEGTSKMAPRPNLKTQVDKSEKSAQQHFEREIAKALKNPRG